VHVVERAADEDMHRIPGGKRGMVCLHGSDYGSADRPVNGVADTGAVRAGVPSASPRPQPATLLSPDGLALDAPRGTLTRVNACVP
jgi:hypothetical protein